MKISFSNEKKHLGPPIGLAPEDEGLPLMFLLLKYGHPVASSCQGEGVCGKCRIKIVDGQENISAKTALEEALIKKNGLLSDERIGCQIFLKGSVVVDTNYW